MRRRNRAERQPAVCIVRHNYYPDGHVRRDAETLVEAGFDTTVIALRRPGQPAHETLNGVHVRRLPVQHRRGSALRYAWEYLSFALLAFLTLTWLHLRKRLRAVEVDNMPDILVFSALVPKLTGTPIILYIFDNMPELLMHVRRLSRRHPVVRALTLLERVSARFADHVIVTQEMARRVVVGRGVPDGKVTVVLNGPDEQIFTVEDPRTHVGLDGPFRIVTHGALLERYGIQVLLDALSTVVEAVDEVQLDIFGEGEYRQALERRARENGVEGRVHFHGLAPLADLLSHLRGASVGYAGMLCDLMLSNKLMEFVALGVPAAVAHWPTFEHYFPDDCVTYFEPGDAVDLARALIAIHRNPDLAEAGARRAAVRYQQYRWSVQRDVYLGIYRGLLGTAVEQSTRRPLSV